MEECARAATGRMEVAGELTWQRGGSVACVALQREEGIAWASGGGRRVL
jgi:hypothetical protein